METRVIKLGRGSYLGIAWDEEEHAECTPSPIVTAKAARLEAKRLLRIRINSL